MNRPRAGAVLAQIDDEIRHLQDLIESRVRKWRRPLQRGEFVA
jgi:hypothetical protein